MKKTLILSVLLLLPAMFLFAQEAEAKNDVIGIFGKYNKRQKFFDSEGGALYHNKNKKYGAKMITEYAAFGQLRSEKGLEWAIPNEPDKKYDDEKRIYIVNQKNKKVLDSLNPFPKYRFGYRSVAVGDLYPKYAGDEIAVCRTGTVRPLVKIFGYDEKGGFELIKSFRPFGKKTKTRRSCQAMAIGDYDGDGKNDLFVAKSYSRNYPKAKVFNRKGKLIGKFERNMNRPIKAGDIDGDGKAEIVYRDRERNIIAVGQDNMAKVVITSDVHGAGGSNIAYFSVGDVDRDGKDEIVYNNPGKKMPIHVVDENGWEQTVFQAFPKGKISRPNRHIFIGHFAY